MNFLLAITFCVIVVNLYTNLVIMQKEHYIPGSCIKIQLRTIKYFNYYLPFWSKSFRPKFTRRLITLFAVSLISDIILIIICALTLNILVLIFATMLSLLVVEFAALILLPLENKLATKYIDQASKRLRKVSPIVVGITGSHGKTSTKNHLNDLLLGVRKTLPTPASWNNKGGISRAINEKLEDGTEVFIAEMGMYKLGEIRDLCKWVKPSISVITSIGKAHLERIGSIENIIKAKSEITENADTVVLWVSDENLEKLSLRLSDKKVIRCGYQGATELDIQVEILENEIIFLDAKNNIIGKIDNDSRLHPSNVACALGVCITLNIDLEKMADKISKLTTPEHRATIGRAERGYIVIDNTFNSNFEGAINNIAKLNYEVKDGRKIVVTPGMVELGSEQYQLNFDLAKEIVTNGAELIITHRTNRKAMLAGAKSVGKDVKVFNNRDSAVKWVRENLTTDDGVLYENDLPIYYP